MRNKSTSFMKGDTQRKCQQAYKIEIMKDFARIRTKKSNKYFLDVMPWFRC